MAMAKPIPASNGQGNMIHLKRLKDVLVSVAAMDPSFEGEEESVGSLLSLPFVRNASPAEQLADPCRPRIFWCVHPSGNYSEDCETGERYALLALDHMTRHNFPALLPWAVFDMMRAGPKRSGIETGFLDTFARHASAAHRLLDLARKGELV